MRIYHPQNTLPPNTSEFLGDWPDCGLRTIALSIGQRGVNQIRSLFVLLILEGLNLLQLRAWWNSDNVPDRTRVVRDPLCCSFCGGLAVVSLAIGKSPRRRGGCAGSVFEGASKTTKHGAQ